MEWIWLALAYSDLSSTEAHHQQHDRETRDEIHVSHSQQDRIKKSSVVLSHCRTQKSARINRFRLRYTGQEGLTVSHRNTLRFELRLTAKSPHQKILKRAQMRLSVLFEHQILIAVMLDRVAERIKQSGPPIPNGSAA